MAQHLRFTSPDELRAYVEQHVDTDANTEELHVEMALVQSLSTTPLPPSQTNVTSPANLISSQSPGVPMEEYESISNLAKAWRREWVPFLKKFHVVLTSVKFDHVLPAASENERKMYWDRGGFDRPGHQEVRLLVSTDKYFDLIILMATETRMVKRSSGLRFDANSEGMDMRNDSRWSKLARQLGKLST